MNANGTRIDIERALRLAVTAGSVLFWAMVLYHARPRPLPRMRFAVLFVGGLLVLYAVDESRHSLSRGDRVEVVALFASTLVLASVTVHLHLHFDRISIAGSASSLDYALAALLVFAVLYLLWREFGPAIPALVVGAIAYAVLGRTIPGTFGHDGVGIAGVLDVLVTGSSGFYGFGPRQVVSVLPPFVLYAALLFGFGAHRPLQYVAAEAEKHVCSGVAGTSLLASAAVGSIDGSYLANARLAGEFTVPAMEREGLPRRTAAGIEAAASTVGQALPPIMGLGALAVASLLFEVGYLDVVVASVAPAVILLTCLLLAVHLAASSAGSPGVSSDRSRSAREPTELPEREPTAADAVAGTVRFGAPAAVLVYALFVERGTLAEAAVWTAVSMLCFGIGVPVLRRTVRAAVDGSWFRESARHGDGPAHRPGTGTLAPFRRSYATAARTDSSFGPLVTLVDVLADATWGLRRAAVVLAPVVLVLVAIEGAVELLLSVEAPQAVAELLAGLGDGGLLFVVVLALVLSFGLTVGLPTLAAVGVVGLFVGPVLITAYGIGDVAATFAVLYAAIAAGVVPRRGTAAAETGRIAGVATRRVSGVAVRLAAPLFVLPFAVVYHPELVSMAPGVATLRAGLLTLLGGVAVVYALNYPFELALRPRWSLRSGLFVVGAVAMVHPSVAVQAATGVIFVLAVVAVGALTRE